MNQSLYDYPMSQLYRDALDPDVREIVEQEDKATAMSDLQEDVIDLQRQIARLAAQKWLQSRGYYSGHYYPEERVPKMTSKPPAKPPPTPPKPSTQPRAKGGMRLPEIGKPDGEHTRGPG